MESFESGLECEDTRVDTNHQAAQEIMESAQHSLQQMYGEVAEQICSACCYAPLCHFHIGIWQTLKTAVLGTTPNKQSVPPVICECCEVKLAEISVCYDCYNKPA